MPAPHDIPDPRELLHHDAFLRRLARGLVRQGADADDLVQETYARAIRAGQRPGGSPRAWLGVIARRLAWRRDARESDRRRRESHARAHGGPRTAAAAWEREDLRQRVVDAVRALPPLDREVITLRYLEDLPLREVARLLSCPVETVRTRQKRAQQRLRRKLEADHPASWQALIGLAGGALHRVPIAALLGGVLPKYVMASAVLLLLALGFWAWHGDAPSPASAPVDADRPVSATLEGRKDASAKDAEPSRPAPRQDAEPRPLVLLVRDRVSGIPIPAPHAYVPAEGGTRRIDASGESHLQLPPDAVGQVEVGAAGYVTQRLEIQAGDASPRIVELIPHLQLGGWKTLTGVVVDTDGRPVVDARITATDMSWWTHETLHMTAHSEASGKFSIVVPTSGNGRGHTLRAHHPTAGSGLVESGPPGDFSWGPAPHGQRPRQRGLRIVLRPARSLRIGIDGPPRARSTVYRLEIRPARDRYNAVLAPPESSSVRHGDPVALRVGVWCLRLLDPRGGFLAAPPRYIEVRGTKVFETTPKPTRGWDDATWTRGPAIEQVTFTLEERTTRIRIRSGGNPVAGARVRIESAQETDPWRMKYAERNAAGGIMGSGILAEIQPGRRVIDSRARTGVTNAQGELVLEGWVPEPALVRIGGAQLVERFIRVEDWPLVSTWTLERGGTLDVRIAAWMHDSMTLRRLENDELIWIRRRDLPLTLPPGDYVARLRQWGRDGRSPQERKLAPAFTVRSGEAHTLDLREVPAPVRLTLRLRPAHAQGTVRIRNRGGFPPQDVHFEEGVATWDVVAIGRSQVVIAWGQANGVLHSHRVMLEGALGNADESIEKTLDLDYRGGSIELLAEHELDQAAVLSVSGRDLAAPFDYGHTARVALQPRVPLRVTMDDLPPGTYRLHVADPEISASVDEVHVRAGATTRVQLRLQRSITELKLRPSDPARPISALTKGWVEVKGPVGAQSRGTGVQIGSDGRAFFRKLKPGTYAVRVSWPGDVWMEPGRMGWHFVDVGSIEVTGVEQTIELSVPTREK